MKCIKLLILLQLLMIAEVKAQESVPDSLKICINGGFETGEEIYYNFYYDTYLQNTYPDCSIVATTPFTGMIGQYNNTLTHVSLVDNDPLLEGGFDQALYPQHSIGRVHSGNYAIKLNNDEGRADIVTMTRTFKVEGPVMSFYFAPVSGFNDHLGKAPRFTAKIRNSAGDIVSEYCMDLDSSNGALSTSTDGLYLFRTWTCVELVTVSENEESLLGLGDIATVEFTIFDRMETPFAYATVYIDDICNVSCKIVASCEPTLELHDDVASGTDEREVSEWIKAYNTIESGATAIYHAGELVNDVLIGGEIVLLPKTTEDPIGFECLAGSIGHFYIKECPGSFEARHAMTKPEEPVIKPNPTATLQIFPNPTNSELNILSDAAVRSVTMVSLDGKLVLERQPGADDNKNIRLDVSNLSSGIYILNVETTDGTVTTHKIVRE